MTYEINQIVLADRRVNKALDKYGGDHWQEGRIVDITYGLLSGDPIYHVDFIDYPGGVITKEENIKPIRSGE